MQFLFSKKDAALPKAMCLYSSDLSYANKILSVALFKGDLLPCPLFHYFFKSEHLYTYYFYIYYFYT